MVSQHRNEFKVRGLKKLSSLCICFCVKQCKRKDFYARNNFDLKIVQSKIDSMCIIEKKVPSQLFCVMKRFMYQEQENEYL